MRFWGLTLLWVAGAVWISQTLVPVPPTWSIEYRESVNSAVITPQHELAVVVHRLGLTEPKDPFCRGPIEIWSLPEGKKVRETFANADEILTPNIPPCGVVVLRREGRLLAADVNTGAVIHLLPGDSQHTPPVVNLAGTHVLYSEEKLTRLYDLVAGRQCWEVGRSSGRLRFGPDFVVMYAPTRGWFRGGQIEILNLATGKTDDRFAHLGVLREIHTFEDSRYVVILSTTGWQICNAHTGAVLWSLETAEALRSFRFDEQDTVLCCEVADQDGNLVDVRWRAADGAVLTPLPPNSQQFAQRQTVPGGRYVVDGVIVPTSPIQLFLRRVLSRWRSLESIIDISLLCSYRVVDTKYGISRGLLSEREAPVMAQDGSGCVVVRVNRVDYYDFPPAPNWAWLARWGLLPPAGVWGLRWWRRRSSGRPTPKDVPPQATTVVTPDVPPT